MDAFVPFLIGICLTIAVLGISGAIGLHKERGVWPSLLIAIATFYIVFALEHSDNGVIAFQSVIALGFMALALIGYKTSLWFIAAGLALHGVFDAISLKYSANPAPDWWGPFCIGVDGLLALMLSIWILRGRIKP